MVERYRHWCFTLNNYTDDDIVELQSFAAKARYYVAGKEVGDSGTPHLQGFVSFQHQQRVEKLQLVCSGRCHWEVARDVLRSIEYCKKDGDFEEIGVPVAKLRPGQGKRTDLHDLRDAINEGERCLKKLRQDFPASCARYPNFVTQLLLDQIPEPELPIHPLRAWQAELLHALKLPPDDRTVVFVVDKTGNSGKTWLTRYHSKVYSTSVCVKPGKKADMVYAFLNVVSDTTRVVFIDCPRSKMDMFQYDFLEELKDGRLMNTKYESRMFEFKVPHVVMFMNEMPDMTKLSEDRYKIISI